MRDYKFKLLKDGKVVGYELHTVRFGKFHIFHSVRNDENYKWLNVLHNPKWAIECDENRQYIGFVDSEDREIYEGDWVEDVMVDNPPSRIRFEEGEFTADGFEYKGFLELCCRGRIKIVDGVEKEVENE